MFGYHHSLCGASLHLHLGLMMCCLTLKTLMPHAFCVQIVLLLQSVIQLLAARTTRRLSHSTSIPRMALRLLM
jgi:hypothetical protein